MRWVTGFDQYCSNPELYATDLCFNYKVYAPPFESHCAGILSWICYLVFKLQGALWSFLANKRYVYIQWYSPKYTVCVLEVKQLTAKAQQASLSPSSPLHHSLWLYTNVLSGCSPRPVKYNPVKPLLEMYISSFACMTTKVASEKNSTGYL